MLCNEVYRDHMQIKQPNQCCIPVGHSNFVPLSASDLDYDNSILYHISSYNIKTLGWV